jgi:hypothetical protein
MSDIPGNPKAFRKLAAILAADIAGYSALMGADEGATVREGIVAKRRDAPYRSGTRSGWIKVKTSEWKEANRYRAKLFEKPARAAGRGQKSG